MSQEQAVKAQPGAAGAGGATKSINVKSQEFQLETPKADVWGAQQETSNILQLPNTNIVDVYEYNFIQELEKIIDLSERFNVIAMDTEFPGVVAISTQHLYDIKEQELFVIRENVAKSKIIQIGISLADEQGRVPLPVSTWQFNFKFDKDKDTITRDALSLLTEAGINFDRFKREGIEVSTFSEYITASDLVLNEDIKWIAFHGGFDFGYFLQMLLSQNIPLQSDQFYAQLKTFFPTIYDIKYLIQENTQIKDKGLTYLAEYLGVKRIGPQHQAGSDSLLTLAVYFKLRENLSAQETERLEKKANVIYNIGKGYAGGREYNRIQAPQIFPQTFDHPPTIDHGGDFMQQMNFIPVHPIAAEGFMNSTYMYAGAHQPWPAHAHHPFGQYYTQPIYNMPELNDLGQGGVQPQGAGAVVAPQQQIPPPPQAQTPPLTQQSVQLQQQILAQQQQQVQNSLQGKLNSRVINKQQF